MSKNLPYHPLTVNTSVVKIPKTIADVEKVDKVNCKVFIEKFVEKREINERSNRSPISPEAPQPNKEKQIRKMKNIRISKPNPIC